MADIAALVTDATMVVIFLVIVVTALCAIKIALGISTESCRKIYTINKRITPAFPCDGTLFILARDGVMYAVPKGKAVIKTDLVREVHCGRVARSCDEHGRFTYCDSDGDEGHGENESVDESVNERNEEVRAMDHINSNWSGSVRSQAMTLSLSDDDSYRASPPESPLAGEMTTRETLMI